MHLKTISFHTLQLRKDKTPGCVKSWLPELLQRACEYVFFFAIQRGAEPIAAVLFLTYPLEKLFFANQGMSQDIQ